MVHTRKRHWQSVLLFVLMVLAVLGFQADRASGSASASAQAAQYAPLFSSREQSAAPEATSGVITATTFFTQTIDVPAPPADSPAADPVFQELLNKGGFFSPSMEVDNGSNLFLGYVRNDGFGAQGKVFRRNAAGQTTGNWDVRVGSIGGIAHKADGLSLVISGPNVLVLLTSHAVNEGPRIMALWGAEIDAVAVPYPDGVRATGKSGASVSGGSTSSDCPSVTEITASVTAAMSPMIDAKLAAFVGTLRPNILQKVNEALDQRGVLTLANIHDSDGLYLRFRETTYEQVGKVLDERGIYRIRTPTPAPTSTRSP